MKYGIHPSKLKYIFLTHIHIDHCVELPALIFGAYLTGKEGEFCVFGPQGIKHLTDSIFDTTYDFAREMMFKLRKKTIDINATTIDKGEILKNNGLVIETIPVEHGFPTNAFVFKADGKKIVFSGDTAPCKNIIDISTDADLLVIECSFPEEFGPIPGHLIPSQVAQIAQEAQAKKIILVHLFPMCKGKEIEILEEIKKIYSGDVQIEYDLQEIKV